MDTTSVTVRWPFYTAGTSISMNGVRYTWKHDLNGNDTAETNELCRTEKGRTSCTLDAQDIALLQSFNSNNANFIHILKVNGVEVGDKKYPLQAAHYSEDGASIDHLEFKNP